MTTLIICIDRDNDIGEKARLGTPVIGRKANIQAAVSLGLADPEDSDINSIFGAVKLYDKLRTGGKTVEVVTVAGDIHVGLDSDTKIMEQLTGLVQQFKANKAILVADGAEDESLLNLLQTKIDIIGIERITVKQERKIEGFYYYIQKAIEDEKMRRVVLPIAFILMAWGISLFIGMEGVMKGFIIFLIGTYLVMKTYHMEGEVNKLFLNLIDQIKERKLSWVFSTISLLLFVAGFFRSIDYLRDSTYYIENGISVLEITFFIYILMIMDSLIVWILFSLLVRKLGIFLDLKFLSKEEETFEDREYWFYLKDPIFWISFGLFFKAGLNIVMFIADPASINFIFLNTMGMIILGIFFFIAGKQLSEQGGEREAWREGRRRFLPYLKRRKKISGWRH